jgi:hypothetical protein
MRVDPYALKSMWTSVLRSLPFRRSSFFVTSLVAPGVLWLIGAVLAGIGSPISLIGLAGLAGLCLLGISSSLLHTRWKSRGNSTKPSTRLVVAIQQAYYSITILLLSFYCIVFAFEIALIVKGLYYNVLLVAYILSVIAGLLWAPRSLPSKPEDDALAARREVKWLPWVTAAQAAAISIGVFLGVWTSRGAGRWEYYLVMGLSGLLGLLMVTFGLAYIYRFFVFATKTIPPEVLQETGIKP